MQRIHIQTIINCGKSSFGPNMCKKKTFRLNKECFPNGRGIIMQSGHIVVVIFVQAKPSSPRLKKKKKKPTASYEERGFFMLQKSVTTLTCSSPLEIIETIVVVLITETFNIKRLEKAPLFCVFNMPTILCAHKSYMVILLRTKPTTWAPYFCRQQSAVACTLLRYKVQQ